MSDDESKSEIQSSNDSSEATRSKSFVNATHKLKKKALEQLTFSETALGKQETDTSGSQETVSQQEETNFSKSEELLNKNPSEETEDKSSRSCNDEKILVNNNNSFSKESLGSRENADDTVHLKSDKVFGKQVKSDNYLSTKRTSLETVDKYLVDSNTVLNNGLTSPVDESNKFHDEVVSSSASSTSKEVKLSETDIKKTISLVDNKQGGIAKDLKENKESYDIAQRRQASERNLDVTEASQELIGNKENNYLVDKSDFIDTHIDSEMNNEEKDAETNDENGNKMSQETTEKNNSDKLDPVHQSSATQLDSEATLQNSDMEGSSYAENPDSASVGSSTAISQEDNIQSSTAIRSNSEIDATPVADKLQEKDIRTEAISNENEELDNDKNNNVNNNSVVTSGPVSEQDNEQVKTPDDDNLVCETGEMSDKVDLDKSISKNSNTNQKFDPSKIQINNLDAEDTSVNSMPDLKTVEIAKEENGNMNAEEENISSNNVGKDDNDEQRYDVSDFVSKPKTTGNIPNNAITLYHSFGFQCKKRKNLQMFDNGKLLFFSGNLVHILCIKTGEMSYLRSLSGGGIGAVRVHPAGNYFAVAENGCFPDVVIYEYPSLKMNHLLKEGTEKSYVCADFSPDGEKLATVGSNPDYMLTIWDWKNETTLLRCKAFSQDVFSISFSPEIDGHLCSSGTGHIRFWTMAETFTGLKLQGEIGRFGTTELSDISGFVELPDGKVLSGCEWGNMLLWDGGLIKVEVSRKGNKPCHQGMIEQFFLDEGELITIGRDGYVKVWDFESIDSADAADVNCRFEIEPMSELKVGAGVQLVSMVKSLDKNESTMWYAQDAAGGIWKLDLSFSHTSHAPKRLFSYHAGAICGMTVSPVTHLAITAGRDRTVRLFDYLSRKALHQEKYNSAATSALWIPKLVDPHGLSVLVGFGDGVVRLLKIVHDDNQIKKSKSYNNLHFKLTQAFKPHSGAVNCMAINGEGKILATAGEDSTVFFFSVDKNYSPIGFVEVEDCVVSLHWSTIKQGSTLLVCCAKGKIYELSHPQAGDADTTKSYCIELSKVSRKTLTVKSIKQKLLQEIKDKELSSRREEKRKIKEAEKKRRRDRGIEEDEEDDDENETDSETESEEEEIDKKLGKIIQGFYRGDAGHFFVLLDGFDCGYLYECEFPNTSDSIMEKEPIDSVQLIDLDRTAVRSLSFSQSGNYLAFGLDDGAIRLNRLVSSNLKSLDSYWSLNMHDNQRGAIHDIRISFDEKFLLSAGEDGNLFVFSFMDEKKLKEILGKSHAEVSEKIKPDAIATIDDIDDEKHYSIEVEKQKAEHEKMVKLAEAKKHGLRQDLEKMRRQFKKLIDKNNSFAPYLRLKEEEFIIDPEMKSDILRERDEAVEGLKKELSWDKEKNNLLLTKVQHRFKDPIECEHIVVNSSSNNLTVSTYRSSHLPPEFHSMAEANRQRSMSIAHGEGAISATVRKVSIGARVIRRVSGGVGSLLQSGIKKKPQAATKLDGKIGKAIEKAEQNKKRRLERQKEWDSMYQSKPDENYEDPDDLAAIKYARENIGDFKLKTAADYVVPEAQRVNADKKRAQVLKLMEMIHDMKENFNDEVISLRQDKLDLIENTKDLLKEAENIQLRLPCNFHSALPDIPNIGADEQPEKMFEYTKEDLLKFRNRKNSKTGHDENDGLGNGGFGGFDDKEQPAPMKTSSQMTKSTGVRGRSISILSTISTQARSEMSSHSDDVNLEIVRPVPAGAHETLNTLHNRIHHEQEKRLCRRRDEIVKKIKDCKQDFDNQLVALRKEKIRLDVVLKNADLRLITLFEELLLLKDFEKRENDLAAKFIAKIQEKEQMQINMEECQEKLTEKREELDKLFAREKTLNSTLSQTIGDGNKFETFLTKVYRKKMKRARKKIQEDDGDGNSSNDDSDEDDSDDDYDSDDEDFGSDADDFDDSVCPPGCDQAVYDQICQLREKRLDLEEVLTDEKKANDTLKKELDTFTKKVKIIDSALNSAQSDLDAFQREKQQKLNELNVVATLRLNQIQHIVDGVLPVDLSGCLVLPSQTLGNLQSRIKELDIEKMEQRTIYKERKQQHIRLIRDKRLMLEKIKELEDKVKQTQMLKFGRLVDIEKLETVSINRAAEELKDALKKEEMTCIKQLSEMEKKIDNSRSRLTNVTRENTKRLDIFTRLLHEKNELGNKLNNRQKSLGSEFQGARQADIQERQRLAELLQLQSEEVDRLKDEIRLLSRKGGHIMPPVHGNSQLTTSANN